MKHFFLLPSLLVMESVATIVAQVPSVPVTAAPATATPAPVQHNIMLNVENKISTSASGGTTDRSTTLQITIRNLNKFEDSMQVEYYFCAKSIESRSTEDIFDSGTRDVTIKPSDNLSVEVTSNAAETTKGTDAVGNNRTYEYHHGTQMTGWVVKIVADGKVLAVRGSDFKHEDMAKGR